MRTLTVVGVVALVSLGGCAAIEQQHAKEAFARDKATCRSTIPRSIGSYERRAECIATAMDQDLEPAFPNDADRVEAMAADTILIGQQIDQGKISPEQGNAELARIGADLSEQSREEALERQRVASEQSTQLLNASAALMQAGRPTYAPSPYALQPTGPVTTSCLQTGALTSCTTQ